MLNRYLTRLKAADLKIVSGAAMGLGMKGVAIVLGLIQIPLLISYLGSESYGLFLVLGQFAAWIALADPGIANSLIGQLAKSEANLDHELGCRAFSTACFFLLTLALLAWVAIGLMMWLFPVGNYFKIQNPELVKQLPFLTFLALAIPVLSILASVVPKAYLAFQEHATSTIIHVLGMLVAFVGVLWVTRTTFGIAGVMFATGLTPVLVGSVLLMKLLKRRPWLRPRWSAVSVPMGKIMLSIGLRIMLLQVFWLLLSSIGEFVVSSNLGVAANASYGTAMKIGNYVNTLPVILYSYLWPAYSNAYARGDIPWIRKRFLVSTALLVASSLLAFGVLAMVGTRLVEIWTHGKLHVASSFWWWMIPWGVVLCFISQINCLCNASGHLNRLLFAAGFGAVLNCILANQWVHRYGLDGVLASAVIAGTLQVLLSLTTVRSLLQPKAPEAAV